MLVKIVSFIMAVVMGALSYIVPGGQASVAQLFPNAYALYTEQSDFLDDIKDSDVSLFDENTGYLKNTVLLFLDDDAAFFKKLDALDEIGGNVIGSIPELGLCVVATADSNYEKLTQLCAQMQQHDAVALATVCPARKVAEQYTPNDPFSYEWDTNGWYPNDWNEAIPSGNNWWLEAIEARAAWGYSSYFNHINLGVVDSGFVESHEDLEGKIVFPSSREASYNKQYSHGTHVAGIIAAKGDNNKGLCGVCQNSTLTCVVWNRTTSWAENIALFFSLSKAVKAGAKVINYSVGSVADALTPVDNMEGILYSYAMGSLLNKGYDFVVVQSAGNGDSAGNPIDCKTNGLFCSITESNAFLPFANVDINDVLDRIIIVGAAYYKNGKYYQADFSNVGKNIDISAPGTEIYSSVSTGYTIYDGTSMSAPVVTGVAGLVWSVDESLTGSEVKEIICSGTKYEVKPNAYYEYEEYLELQNYPLLNAKLAVEKALAGKYDMQQVTVLAGAQQDVTLTNEAGDVFAFETDKEGKLSCLLEKGAYTVSVNGKTVYTSFTVNGATQIDCLQGYAGGGAE